MPQTIDIPGVGLVDFPDTMSDADISAAAAKLHAGAQPQQQAPAPAQPQSRLDEAKQGFIRGFTSAPGNMVKGVGNFISNYANPMHPVDTALNIARLPGEVVDSVAHIPQNVYEDVKNGWIGKTIEHPGQFAEQLGDAVGQTALGEIGLRAATAVPGATKRVLNVAERNPKATGMAVGYAGGTAVGHPWLGVAAGRYLGDEYIPKLTQATRNFLGMDAASAPAMSAEARAAQSAAMDARNARSFSPVSTPPPARPQLGPHGNAGLSETLRPVASHAPAVAEAAPEVMSAEEVAKQARAMDQRNAAATRNSLQGSYGPPQSVGNPVGPSPSVGKAPRPAPRPGLDTLAYQPTPATPKPNQAGPMGIVLPDDSTIRQVLRPGTGGMDVQKYEDAVIRNELLHAMGTRGVR